MKRLLLLVSVISVFGLLSSTPSVRAQDTVQPTSENGAQEAQHIVQLRNIREGLVDPNAREEQRRRWADMLLSYDTPQARSLAGEMLTLTSRPDVQRAVCGVLAERARDDPDAADPAVVPPLIELLGAKEEDLRKIAASALSEFPGSDVPSRLGQLAARDDISLSKRLAAIDALAPNTHRRDVAAQLISLLDAGQPQITQRVVIALEPATQGTFGVDLRRWRSWWAEQSKLSNEDWLEGQVQIYRDRSRRVADEFLIFRSKTNAEREAMTSRMRAMQRELFRSVPPEQRDGDLAGWLREPVPIVQETALAIIKAQVADEGKRPNGEVLGVLFTLLSDGEPKMRREVLDIVQNLRDPEVVQTVLAQLQREQDAATRNAIFRALGNLNSPAAIDSLIREIEAPESLPDCVREAAIALGGVAGQAPEGTDWGIATGPLKSRYQSTDDNDIAMRSALLTAMAGLGQVAFAPEFLDALGSNEAAILRPAIRGMISLDDRSKLPRLRTLTADADPPVRLAAIEAVGHLGSEDADVESLLTRLNPTIEANELVRNAAWRAFRDLLAGRPKADRIRAASRLRDLPEYEIAYLVELAGSLSSTNGDAAQLESLLERLAQVLVEQGRPHEAADPLRRLYDLRLDRGETTAFDTGKRLLAVSLGNPTTSDPTALIRQLSDTAPDDAQKRKILELVLQHLQAPEWIDDPENARTLLAALRTLPPELVGDDWNAHLQRAQARLDEGDTLPMRPTPEGG